MVRRRGLAPIVALALLVAAGCEKGTTQAGGTTPMAPQQQVAVGPGGQLQPGTVLWVTLDERLSLKDTRVGEKFSGHVAQDVTSTQGELLVPRGAVVTGHVVDVRPGGGDEPAAIGLAFDSIQMGGVTQPLKASVQETDVPSDGTDISGRDVLTGAAVGAILGGLIEGGRTGLIVGGALGAGAGTLISLGRDGEKNELPAGTALQARLEEPVRSLAAIRGRVY